MRDDPVSAESTLDVTIVVAVYNGVKTIEACVSSLLAQRYPRGRFEVVVVDNRSSDATLDRLRGFGGAIRVLSEATRGAAAARNRGIRCARGRLVAFTDADGVVEPDWLSALVAPLRDPQVGVVGGRISSRAGANRIEQFGDMIHDQQRAVEIEDPPYVMTANWASPRGVMLRVGLFDPSLLRGQDVDLAWRIHRAGYRLVYAPNAVVHHFNERTVFGLMREGYLHGLNGVRLNRKHAVVWPHVRRRCARSIGRLHSDLGAIARGRTIESLLWFLFDSGKSVGELIALARGARWRREPRTS